MANCSICFDLDLNHLAKRPPNELEPNEIVVTLSSLHSSAALCEACRILSSGLSAICEEGVRSLLRQHRDPGVRFLVFESSIKALFPAFRTDLWFTELEYFTQDGAYAPFGSGLGLSEDPDCMKNYQIISRGIEDCISHHPRCQPPIFDAARFPKRLLVLNENASLKLVESMGQQLKYAALSHCWGLEPLLSLTKSTPRNSQGDIEFHWDKLPKFFQDAGRVSRGLGISYL
jgi:hypothetical protein